MKCLCRSHFDLSCPMQHMTMTVPSIKVQSDSARDLNHSRKGAVFDSQTGFKAIKTIGMMWGNHVVVMQGQDLSDAVIEGLRSVNLLADKAGDKLVSSYRSFL